MNTKLIKISVDDTIENYNEAARLLKDGQVVGIPTETVYGLAGNAYSEEAVKRIFEAKGRPQDNPLIVHISEFSEIYDLVSSVPAQAKALAEAFWPGPLTMILPKSDKVPLCVTAGLDTVAVRCPKHPVANRLIKATGLPLAAPSANLSGKPSPTKAQHVYDDLNGRVPMIIDGGECDEGVESTVVTLATSVPKLLRPGNITLKQLKSVLGEVQVDDAVLNPLKDGEKVSSPGMKYKHYSPDARVIVVKGSYEKFKNYVNHNCDSNTYAMVFKGEGEGLSSKVIEYGVGDNYRQLSHALFDSLRYLDEKSASKCFVRCPDDTNDDNLAVLNRLLRAAAFEVVDLSGKLLVGLTGKTGAGKSTISALFKEKGAYVIDGDIVARKVLEEDKALLTRLESAFEGILNNDGTLNRKALASKAFSSPEGTQKLNSILHPAINDYIHKESFAAFENCDVVLVDAAAIIESGFADECDILLVAHAPFDIRKERILKRDSISEEDALIRMNGQKDDEFYLSKADIVINNYPPYDLNEEFKKAEKLIYNTEV